PRGNRQVRRAVYEPRRIRAVAPPAPLKHNALMRRRAVYAHRDIIIEVIGQPRWSVTKIRILRKHAFGKAHVFKSYTIPHHNWNAVKSTLQQSESSVVTVTQKDASLIYRHVHERSHQTD